MGRTISDQASTTSSQRPLIEPSSELSIKAPPGSKISRIQKLNPFAKNETPEEKQARLAEEKRKKELIEKYGFARPQLEGIGAVGGPKGAKRGSSIVAAAAFAASGSCGGG